MSTEHNDSWTLGETWSLEVLCTDLDGDPINPNAAHWRLRTLDGTTVLALTNGDGIVIAGNVCTITVPTGSQGPVTSQTYRHRLKITDSGGAESRQVHGLIKVLPDE